MQRELTYLGRLFVVICIAVWIGTVSEGCGIGEGAEQGSGSADRSGVQSADTSRFTGTIRLAGSTSMEKLSNAWAESFMEKYPDIRVTVEFVGSSAGVEAVLSGGSDIGNSSRSLRPDEKAGGAVENLVAVDGIVICVDPTNKITELTLRQLSDIYTGVVTNWSVLGGADLPTVVVGREAGSGTRVAFEEVLGVADQCDYANELDSTGAVMARVASTPGAIGYISMDMVNDSVRILSLEGVEPSAENIGNGRYPLSRPFVMATRGEIAQQDQLVQMWFDHIYSEEGQSIAEQLGFVRVR